MTLTTMLPAALRTRAVTLRTRARTPRTRSRPRSTWTPLKGTVQRFIPEFGYGFITPADTVSFPWDVKLALAKQIKDAKACRSPIVGADALYFSEKDVTHDGGVELTAGAQVTFQIRADNKGPSAFDVSQAI